MSAHATPNPPAPPATSVPSVPSATDSQTARFYDILKRYWGYDSFRSIQLDIIRSIAGGNDTLGLMPTGGGKSITFQVPAMAMEGMTIVVTPLVALMKDQVEHLCRRGMRAAAIYADQSHDDNMRHLDNAVFGAYKFLYVSPERLGTEVFQNKVRRMNVAFITVDEAHCISQWGYDFRPAYLQIARLRDLLPHCPILALTATATPEVVEDICRSLRFCPERQAVFRMGFARQNLNYVVRHTDDKDAQLLHILQSVPGSAIVYTRNRQGTAILARMLCEAGMEALYFHAGLSAIDKDIRQRAWTEGKVRIMVATNAFGMGIDKPDVRLVVHYEMPDSIEAYYQEAGRAGRDGKRAYAVLLYDKTDRRTMLMRIGQTFPPKDYIADTYDHLAYFFQLALGDGYGVTYEFDMERFCTAFRQFPVQVNSALHLLTQAGYIDYREEDTNTSRLMFLVQRDELYRLRQLDGDGERVTAAVLRLYAGMFADYVPVSEAQIAHESGLTPDAVYIALLALTRERILHYIPRKQVPRITYVQRRVERAIVPPEVYEKRLDAYTRRINAMLNYAEADACRSHMLLDYFADPEATDCGICDVCRGHARHSTETERRRTMERLLNALADGQPHDVQTLLRGQAVPEDLGACVQQLIDDGRAVLSGQTLRLVADD